jgi:hypothetical protein
MFESGISVNRTTKLSHASQRALSVMDRAAQELCHNMPEDRRPPASMFSTHIWAMSHGVVELFARNSASAQSPFATEDLLETGIAVYLRGLGVLPPDG